MKKRNLLLFFTLCMFMFVSNVKGVDEYNIECDSATVDVPFTCNITTNQTVYVNTDLQVYQGSTKISKDSSIEFKANKADKYDIALVSEDKSTTYKTITINVSEKTTTTKTTTTTTKAKSSNNYLSSITIDGEEIDDFSKNTTKYFIDVENDVTSILVDAKAEDDAATVDVDGPRTLEVGDNEFTISVTSEDETTKFYKVIVTRLDEEESSNTKIKKIKIKDYHFNFDKNSKTFYLNIDKEDTELDITVTLSDKSSSYEIEGNENLEDGSVIKIIVTAENGNTDTYRIIIEKKDTNYLPFIIGGVILILLIAIIIFIIVKNNKKKKAALKEKNNNNNKAKKVIEQKDYDDEKTIEMPPLNNDDSEVSDVTKEIEKTGEDDDDIPLIDNDEEEETRILSYAERKELERANALQDDDIGSIIDNELNKKLSNDSDDDEYY